MLDLFGQQREEGQVPYGSERKQRALAFVYATLGVSLLIRIGEPLDYDGRLPCLIRLAGWLNAHGSLAHFFLLLAAAFRLESLYANLLLIPAAVAHVKRAVLIGCRFADQFRRFTILRVYGLRQDKCGGHTDRKNMFYQLS